MSLIKAEAIILRAIPYRETSSIVKIFTNKAGTVSVIAKGARRLKSSFRGYLEPFNHVEVIYYYRSTREVQTLASVELLRTFFKDFLDVEKLLLPYSILEYLEKFTVPGDESKDIFRLTIDVFELMEANPQLMEVYFAQFLFDFATIHGYRVDVVNCENCGKPLGVAYYDLTSGKFYCDECSYLVENFLFLSSNVMEALRCLKSRDENCVCESCRKGEIVRLIEFLIRWISFRLDIKTELKSFKVFSMISKNIKEK